MSTIREDHPGSASLSEEVQSARLPAYRAEAWLRTSAFTASVVVTLLGVTVWMGYLLSIHVLVELGPADRAMSPLTAFALILLSVSLWMRFYKTPLPVLFVVGAALLALAALFYRANGIELLSPWILLHVAPNYPGHRGNVSPSTASCLLLLALAILFKSRPLQFIRTGQALSALVGAISGFSLLCYAYQVTDLNTLHFFRDMALPTALSLFLLSYANFFIVPTAGWSAIVSTVLSVGRATRHQLLFAIGFPFAGWWLLMLVNNHYFGFGAAFALLIILTIMPLIVLIFRDGWSAIQLDGERQARIFILDHQQEVLEQKLEDQRQQLTALEAQRSGTAEALAHAQRMDTLGHLSGGIAHDFNNLLMAIRGNLELLSGVVRDTESGRRYLANASVATENGTALTKKLLAFSRTQRLEMRPVHVQSALHTARDLLGSAMGPNIVVSVDFQTSNCWVNTDPDQLGLALLNLAINARDAMPLGGLLMLSSDRVKHSFLSSPPVDCVRISVLDNGEGMSAEVVDRAAEPFFTTKERGRGTGLGLSQAYGFVRQSKGDLVITSEEGIGTRIDIFLPMIEAETVRAITMPIDPSVAATAAACILLIDDDESVRTVLSESLRDAGYQTAEAGNGPEGIEILDHVRPALAIIDFLMPGMNGVEVAEKIRQHSPGLPIIFVSGFYDTMALEGITNVTVLRKPFDLKVLLRTVAASIK